MRRHAAIAISTALAGVTLSAPLALAAGDPSGVWLDANGRGAIEIKACGKGLCGHVVWVKDASDKQKGCGKQIVGEVTPIGGGRWGNGWIYSPERGRKYDVELQTLGNGTLRVVGYAGTKLFSKTYVWKPAPADLERCGTTEAKSAPVAPAESVKVVKADPAPQTPRGQPKVETPAKVDAPIETSSVEKPKPVDTPAPTVKEPAPQPDVTEEASTETTESNDDGEAREGGRLGGLKLGDLDLEQVITRTGGKCKLDLPWVKVKFNCAE